MDGEGAPQPPDAAADQRTTTAAVGAEEPVQYTGGGEPAARGSHRRLWIGLGIGLAVLLLVIAYLTIGALLVSAANAKADRALRTTLSHQDTFVNVMNQDPFKGIDFSSSNPDMTSAKAALASYEPNLPKLDSYIKSDRASLQDARSGLQGNFFTLPESGILAKTRHRVDAALRGLDAAQKGVETDLKAVAFLHPAFDGLAQMEDLLKKMNAQDIDGALAEVGSARSNFQKASALADPPAIAPQMRPALQQLDKLLADVDRLLRAAKAEDISGVTQATNALGADTKALSAIDSNAMQTYEENLTKSYQDTYNSAMKQAAQG